MIQMKKIQYVLASLLAASVFTTAAEAANFNNEVKTQQGVVAGAYDDKASGSTNGWVFRMRSSRRALTVGVRRSRLKA